MSIFVIQNISMAYKQCHVKLQGQMRFATACNYTLDWFLITFWISVLLENDEPIPKGV